MRTARLAGLGFLTGCMGAWPGTGSQEQVDPNVGFVYVGPVGDHGWTKSHDDGRVFLQDQLDVPTRYSASVLPADALSVIDQMVADGSNIVFTTSFDYVSSTQQAATNYPDGSFLNCSGNVSGPNLSSYMGRMYQPIYLAGLLAGSVTETNHVAVLGSVQIPEVVRHINAFALGVREVNPTAIIEVVWIDNFFDVDREPVLTVQLAEHGADVILTQTDTTIPIETANGLTANVGSGDVPVKTIAYDNIDGCSHGDNCLTSAYWNWGPLYARLVQQIADGTWNPKQIPWDQIRETPEESTVALADISEDVAADVRILVGNMVPVLADPANVAMPFVGPIADSGGVERVAAGDALDDAALNKMCWHVEGVVNWDETSQSYVPATVSNSCGGEQYKD